MHNFAAAALCASLGFASSAGAAAISLADFSGTESVVTFNGLSNAQVVSPTFSFAGVTFTNNSNFGGLQYWQPNAFGIGGTVALGQSSEVTDITVNLGTAWQRVGINAGNPAIVGGNFGPANFRVSFFDSNATLLGSVTNSSLFSQPFFGWENSAGILSMRIVEISGPNGVSGWLDNLRFESDPPPPPPAPAPEPASLALLGHGFGALAVRRRNA